MHDKSGNMFEACLTPKHGWRRHAGHGRTGAQIKESGLNVGRSEWRPGKIVLPLFRAVDKRSVGR
jgi:hypothetical protein